MMTMFKDASSKHIWYTEHNGQLWFAFLGNSAFCFGCQFCVLLLLCQFLDFFFVFVRFDVSFVWTEIDVRYLAYGWLT